MSSAAFAPTARPRRTLSTEGVAGTTCQPLKISVGPGPLHCERGRAARPRAGKPERQRERPARQRRRDLPAGREFSPRALSRYPLRSAM